MINKIKQIILRIWSKYDKAIIIFIIILFLSNFINLFGALRELAAGLQDLESQMVFLVNHGGEKFALYHDDAARAFSECVMAADKMAFHEKMSA